MCLKTEITNSRWAIICWCSTSLNLLRAILGCQLDIRVNHLLTKQRKILLAGDMNAKVCNEGMGSVVGKRGNRGSE